MLSQDGLTPLFVRHGGGEMATKDVVAEEKVLKGSSDRVARATDPHCLHHTYKNTRQCGTKLMITNRCCQNILRGRYEPIKL